MVGEWSHHPPSHPHWLGDWVLIGFEVSISRNANLLEGASLSEGAMTPAVVAVVAGVDMVAGEEAGSIAVEAAAAADILAEDAIATHSKNQAVALLRGLDEAEGSIEIEAHRGQGVSKIP